MIVSAFRKHLAGLNIRAVGGLETVMAAPIPAARGPSPL